MVSLNIRVEGRERNKEFDAEVISLLPSMVFDQKDRTKYIQDLRREVQGSDGLVQVCGNLSKHSVKSAHTCTHTYIHTKWEGGDPHFRLG